VPARTRAPRLWTDDALATWALPITGVNATPKFYTEAEYYAAPIDELRTYPVYVKDREPRGYRGQLTRRGPQPLIATGAARTDAEWVSAGKEILPAPSTFPRFNGSPWFTNHMPDLIGVAQRRYLDATATHRNGGPEDIARYAILVTDADDGSIGPYRFRSDTRRKIRSRHSDDAMYAIGKFVYAAQPPPNPNTGSELTVRGEQVFTRAGCAGCHTPPIYTNNKLVPVDGFTRIDHAQSPPAADILVGARLGLDPGLALKTRKGTGYYIRKRAPSRAIRSD
jgi:hypothetical protein